MWFIPERGSNPLLICFDPGIMNVKYIAFSGYSRNKVRYIFDCPVESRDLFKYKFVNDRQIENNSF